ncbi:MAG: amidohydrolase [Rhodospirillales bacterium]|jgi:predicted amidohydrolase YtcJ|nr:amidohydrolase [Rhodospirillales bacterium]MBT4040346.1 amidohydrolase [Rhodospirillales bacterium]MBT4625073.1 amidohydrolase [Rhodospirillales bacterium]MBT5353202.1 amidohydrolase [Rhodospirillales bacterium]MBT5519376.1 amidohydrolase [Rhodospirillales bacterium]
MNSLYADLILTGGKIATMDDDTPFVEALAARDGKIVAIGSSADVAALAGSDTRIIDLAGATAIPGIVDSHCHPDGTALELDRYHLKHPEFTTIDQILDAIRHHAATTGPDEWFMGNGYNNARFDGYPTRQQLDDAAGGRPVILFRMDGHVAVVNSRAFEIAGVPEDVENPEHGQFDRDPETGRLTGVVREGAYFVFRAMFRGSATVEDYEQGLPRVFENYLTHGVTSVHNSVVRPKVFKAYQNLHSRGELNMRVGIIGNGDVDGMVQAMIASGLQSGMGDGWLRIVGVEWIADASVGGRTAAFYNPYQGEPDVGEPVPNTGMQLFSREWLEPRVLAAHEAGLTVCVEGLGDRGVDFALDVIEAALEKCPRDDHRSRIEHCCCVPDAQMARIKKLGVVPSSATGFLHDLGDLYVRNRGADAMKTMFRHRTYIDQGIRAPGHSDNPVCNVNPFRAMWSMVTRTTMMGDVAGPEEAVTITEALHAYTTLGAWAGREEHAKGKLLPGMLADVAVLDRDLFDVPSDEIKDVQVTKTILGGDLVFER